MAHAAHHFQFDQFIGEQSERPVLTPLRRGLASQSDQVGFLFSLEFAFLWPLGLLSSCHGKRQSLGQKTGAHAPDGTLDGSKRLLDLLIRPIGTSFACIDFQQNLGVQDMARWRCPCFDDVLERLPLLLA